MKLFANLLKDFRVHQNTAPAAERAQTPKPEKNKVIHDPTRTPINRQAALIIQPVRSWIYQPLPPEKEPNPYRKELEEAQAQTKTERNEHALTRDALGQTRQRLKDAHSLIEGLHLRVAQLEKEAAEKDLAIARLEDLKL